MLLRLLLRDCWPPHLYRDLSPPRILDQVVAPLLDRVPSRQNDGGGESDYVFTSLMLAAQTLSKWLDGVELLLIYFIISWVYTCLYIYAYDNCKAYAFLSMFE